MEHDPIIAAAAEWEAAYANIQAVCDRPDFDDQDLVEAMNEEGRKAIHALQTVPTTLAGLRTFCEMGAKMSADAMEKGDGMGGWTPGLPLGLDIPTGEEMYFATLASAAGALLPAAAPIERGPDPVFAAIADHCAAWDLANSGKSDAEQDAAGEEEWRLFWVLLRTVPTSRSGLVAYLDHISGERGFGQHSMIDNNASRAILASIHLFAKGSS